MVLMFSNFDIIIVNDLPLPLALKGVWKLHRELHIDPDWLLIYYCPDRSCSAF